MFEAAERAQITGFALLRAAQYAMKLVVLTEVQASCDKLEANAKFKCCVADYPFCFWSTYACASPVRTAAQQDTLVLAFSVHFYLHKFLLTSPSKERTLSFQKGELSLFTLKIASSLAIEFIHLSMLRSIADDYPTRVQFDHKLIQH